MTTPHSGRACMTVAYPCVACFVCRYTLDPAALRGRRSVPAGSIVQHFFLPFVLRSHHSNTQSLPHPSFICKKDVLLRYVKSVSSRTSHQTRLLYAPIPWPDLFYYCQSSFLTRILASRFCAAAVSPRGYSSTDPFEQQRVCRTPPDVLASTTNSRLSLATAASRKRPYSSPNLHNISMWTLQSFIFAQRVYSQ